MPEFDYDRVSICQFLSLQKLSLNGFTHWFFYFNRSFDLMLQRAIFPIVCNSHVWKWWLWSNTRGIVIKCDIIFNVESLETNQPWFHHRDKPFSNSNEKWRRVEVRVDKNTNNVHQASPLGHYCSSRLWFLSPSLINRSRFGRILPKAIAIYCYFYMACVCCRYNALYWLILENFFRNIHGPITGIIT